VILNCNVDTTNKALEIHFDLAEEAREFADTVKNEEGFLVNLEEPLQLFQQFSIFLRPADGPDFDFGADVAQVFDKGGSRFDTAFIVNRWEDARYAAWKRKSASSPGSEAHQGEVTGSSPIHQIRSMTPNQKSRLATRANKTERQILLRENSPQVLQALMLNPRVEAKEVLQVVKSTHSDAGLLKRIASDQRWNKNPEIRVSLVKNLRTPPEIAIRLVPSLRTSDLRFLGKMSSGVRETLRKAAFKEYLSRTSKG
jgi:hypothetical protein